MTNSSREGLPHAWLGLLASSVSAGSLNLAASVLDRPRAFESPLALCLPLGLGVAVFAIAFAASYLLLLPLRVGAAPRAAGIGALWIAVGGLLPLAEVLRRGLSPYHVPAVWALFAAACLGPAACAGLAAARREERPPREGPARGPGLVLLLPFLSVELLGLVWFLEYRGAEVLALPLGAGLALLTWLALGWLERAIGSVAPVASLLAWIAIGAVASAGWKSDAPLPPAGAVGGPSPVVLITVDTLRADHVSWLAPTAPPTPGIDSLLADAYVFDNARSAAPWTKPSLASLLTGLSPLVHGTTTRRARLPEGAETLAERLHAAGYVTGGIGLNVHLEDAFGFGQGFTDYRFPALPEYGVSVGAKVLEALLPDEYPELFPSTHAITDVAIDWVRRHRDQPFFLWVHYLDPHWPYEPPPEYVDEHLRGYDLSWGDAATVTAVQAGNLKLGEADRDWVRTLYEGEVHYTDHELGRLLDELRALGLYDRALIAFASDHGEEFWEHGRYEHGHTLYEEVLRVPLAFKLPGNDRRGRSDAAVSTESLTPTLVEAAGLAGPSGIGRAFTSPSLLGLVEGEAPLPPGPSFATGTYYHGEKEMVLLDGRWKYVADLETGRVELYDLAEDPGEHADLSALHPELVERARATLAERYRHAAELRHELGADAEDTSLDRSLQERLSGLGYAGG